MFRPALGCWAASAAVKPIVKSHMLPSTMGPVMYKAGMRRDFIR